MKKSVFILLVWFLVCGQLDSQPGLVAIDPAFPKNPVRNTTVPLNNTYTEVTNNLVAWYPLAGDVNDHSGNGYNGTAVGSPSYGTGVQGVANGAIVLNGTSQYVSASPVSSTAFTVSAWAKNATNMPPSNFNVVWSYGTGTTWGGVRTTTGIIDLSDFQDIEWGALPNDSSWNMYTMVISNNWIYGYFDGIYYSGSTSGVESRPDNVMNIGGYIGSTADNWNGSIADVRVYTGGLSPSQVMTNFFASAPSLTVTYPQLLYCPMLDQINNGGNYVYFPTNLLDWSAKHNTNIDYYSPNANPELTVWTNNQGNVFNSSMHFHGIANSYIDTHDSNTFNFTNNSFTLSFWAKLFGSGGALISCGVYNTNGWYIDAGTSSQLGFGSCTNGVIHFVGTLGSAFSSGWTHIAAVSYGMTNLYLYVNGIYATNGTISPAQSCGTNTLIMGWINYGPYYSNYLDGDIWCPQMWNTNLQAADIANLYLNQKGGHPYP